MALDWNGVSALAAVAYNMLVIISLYVLWRQLKEIRKSHHGQAWFKILEHLQSVRDERGIVYSLESKPIGEWNAKDVAAAEAVAANYDIVGMLAQKDLIPLDLIVDSWSYSLTRSWRILQPLVEKYRTERQAYRFWDDFEFLAERANAWHKRSR